MSWHACVLQEAYDLGMDFYSVEESTQFMTVEGTIAEARELAERSDVTSVEVDLER